MAAVSGQVFEGLRHERRPIAVFLGNRLRHEFEKSVTIGRLQAIVVVPVHLELAIAVFMIVLIRIPAELQHRVADFTDHVIATH